MAGGIEEFEHGEGVVSGNDFLDEAGGEGGGRAVGKYGGAICCLRNVIEAFIGRAGELTDNTSVLSSKGRNPYGVCFAKTRPRRRSVLNGDAN
ncbi:hypothetical protein CSTAT_01545 [Corynebacterium stationis]|nr:hypothetical protein CSTAT_01545 [Corynebacterium stationis]